METLLSCDHLSNTELRTELTRAIAGERTATVYVIELLIAAERRQVFLEEGYPSMYVYCTDFHHLSESDAFHRIQAARAAARWPQILPSLRAGDLTMSSLLVLAPHLTDDNCDSLLAQARHQPKRAVERIVAGLAPRPDAPPRITPLSLGRYRLQVTIDEETHDSIMTAHALMRSSEPDIALSAVVSRAFTLLVERLLRQKTGMTDRPRQKRMDSGESRTIPAAVRREVWKRDRGRCAFEGARGRCPVTGTVDFHHVIPYALGGQATVENIELRCRAHNLHQARMDGLARKDGQALKA